MSPANLACPVTLAKPSATGTRFPTTDNCSAMLCPLHLLGCVHDRRKHFGITPAAAQVTCDALSHFFQRRIRIALEESDAGHDKARRADAALESHVIPVGLLHRVEFVPLGQALNSDYIRAIQRCGEDRARVNVAVVD